MRIFERAAIDDRRGSNSTQVREPRQASRRPVAQAELARGDPVIRCTLRQARTGRRRAVAAEHERRTCRRAADAACLSASDAVGTDHRARMAHHVRTSSSHIPCRITVAPDPRRAPALPCLGPAFISSASRGEGPPSHAGCWPKTRPRSRREEVAHDAAQLARREYGPKDRASRGVRIRSAWTSRPRRWAVRSA